MPAATDVANRHIILSFSEMSNVTGAVDLSFLVLRLFTAGVTCRGYVYLGGGDAAQLLPVLLEAWDAEGRNVTSLC